jgi:hypothetical protein
MEATVNIRPADSEALPALERAGAGVVRVERADLVFACDPPLDAGFFPGPALRGLLGRLLERQGSPEAMDFLCNRFKGEGVAWGLSFTEAPGTDGFRLRLSAFGPKAELDVAAIVAAFSLSGAELRLPGLRTRLSLEHAEDLEGCAITFGEAPEAETRQAAEPGGDCEIHFVTPVVIHRDGKPWLARDWAGDATPLLDSARLRLADLAGIRRKMAPKTPPARFLATEVADVRLNLPLAGRRQSLGGVLGSVRIAPAPPYSLGLLKAAELIGLGRSVSYGFGTVGVR